MNRVVHNPRALLEAEIEHVKEEVREHGFKTHRGIKARARLDGLVFAIRALDDGCTELPPCPHEEVHE